TVVVSCFDPVRREVARVALSKLVADGRIHPGRIEEVVEKSKKEVDAAIQDMGEQAAYEVGAHGLNVELIRLIGRMQYRTSYGQNILHHSKEVAHLAGIMAAELGLDVTMAKRGALLHDIGKVLTHEHEGTHVQLGVEVAIQDMGEQAAYEVGAHGLHAELIKLVGRMHYRTSYGQNILQHSKEVAHLAGIMAAELGLDVVMAKRGALLHDIGKVLTHEHEGTHVQLGVEVATKYGEHPLIVNCIAAHHDDVPHESEVSVLVQAADAISGSRPGARREAFETYVKRLEGLERIAASYTGVEKVFAIQAGREVRVIVNPDDVDDARMTSLSEEIARRIEGELQYPGQIKVVVIREQRAVDFAR
ncbi:MAG TPA: HDIG domain-containing metalloprotein, partial [Gemmatimonadaceae bacterium]